MKKFLLSFLAVAPLLGYAQTILSRADFFQSGMSYVKAVDTTFNDLSLVQKTGAGQEWDFSTLQAHQKDTVQYSRTSKASEKGPELIQQSTLGSLNQSYLEVSETGVAVVGYVLEGPDQSLLSVVPQKKDKVMAFPLAFGAESKDTVHFGLKYAQGKDSIKLDMEVFRTSKIQGQGLLQLPSGSYKALQEEVKETQYTYSFVQQQGEWVAYDTLIRHRTNVVWYGKGQGVPLLEIGLNGQEKIISCVFRSDAFVSRTLRLAGIDAMIYPNPAQDQVHLNVEGFDGEKLHIEFFDVSGLVAKKLDVQNTVEGIYMDCSQLPIGVYQVQISDGDKVVRQSLLVQR